MSGFKGTPGPWAIASVDDDPCDGIKVIGRPSWPCNRFGEQGVWDIAVASDLFEENVEEQIANARLIAAAPDMLAALIEMEQRFGHVKCMQVGAARLAINSALGTPASEGEE